MDVKEIDILGDDIAGHWYYQSKARAMRQLLGGDEPGKILDVGAGSGFFSRYLLATTQAAAACCVDISYGADSEGGEGGKPVYYRRSVERSDADLVLLMDVLEHVDDDAGLLATYADKVPPGTRFLISVPAFQFLWSGHDEFLEHKRRYTLAQLEAVAGRAGLEVKYGGYYFGLVFPLAWLTRLGSRWLRREESPARSQLKRHHPWVNALLGAVCRVELPFARYNRLAGLTVFCLAVRA
ncbi:methyltransferase domain-containing protein [Methylomagnum ishizawai]|uniref:methyltransferase domain-containing protein n=1 Tax=Methylomagnum ishizawai TaxID=1760988 RepID=UPI001C33A4D9|nr:methyltransferase domain-containing protein [Methylomagnum ishizawai]BBL74701.1 hypothetical protein MishRS11D_17990 [Methylomagnum ishizawai]